ncbi:MAG: glycoside hydrolase family 5 protein [Planctomycetes bacterium]|nr:glycoside hydrolase family 5 protein [Planctomycetota bacterium]
MFSRPKSVAVILLVIIWSTCAFCADSGVNLNDPCVVNKLIGRGVNIGNSLEAPKEGDWDVILQEEYFQLIKDAGFNSIRLPVRWDCHTAEKAPYAIDPNFLARVDWAIKNALSRNLVLIINMHNYYDLFTDPNNHKDRYLAIWQQIAERYKDYPNTLLFEALNEPQDNLKGVPEWNALLKEWLAVIRKSNPNRMVVIGSANFNGYYEVKSLDLPKDDRNIIVTFHYYTPLKFTHQGAHWVKDSNSSLGMKWKGTDQEKRAIARDFRVAANWGKENNRPIYLGEFGTFYKADPNSRAQWTKAVADEAVNQGFSFAYWEFCAGFGLYDPNTNSFRKPLLEAVIPPKQ